MPIAGESFITTLQKSHLEWGSHRHTFTRGIIYGEGYLQIPRSDAIRLGIYNSNNTNAINIFTCNSADGFLNSVSIKAAGSSTSGDPYAKQLQGNGDLKIIGNWFNHINAQIGDKVKVTWTSPTEIEIEKL